VQSYPSWLRAPGNETSYPQLAPCPGNEASGAKVYLDIIPVISIRINRPQTGDEKIDLRQETSFDVEPHALVRALEHGTPMIDTNTLQSWPLP